MRETHYGGSIDGDIKKYLKEMHENGAVCPTFRGYEPFKQLWDLGVITLEVTSIRLMHGIGNDEHYIVADENNLEGITLMAHSGQPGLHNIKEILTKTKAKYWEIRFLDPKIFRE